jgi:hypothetical protein
VAARGARLVRGGAPPLSGYRQGQPAHMCAELALGTRRETKTDTEWWFRDLAGQVYGAAASAAGGRELFRGASADRKGAAVKHIAPISEPSVPQRPLATTGVLPCLEPGA